MKKRCTVCALVLGMTLLFPASRLLAGGIPVIDVSNLAKNALTAIKTAKMVQQLAKQLENEAKNLDNLKWSTVDDFSAELEELFEVVGETQGLVQDFTSLEDKFKELYPDYLETEEGSSYQEVAEKSKEWLANNREVIKGAAKASAKVFESLPDSQERLSDLVQSSSAAPGILQAAQAGNEIAAQMTEQLMQLNVQIATFSDAQIAILAEENAAKAASKKRREKLLDGLEEMKQPTEPVSSKIF